jgi:hypothetical protein
MGGIDITSTAYDSITGQISIASVTGDVVITAVAETAYDAVVEYIEGNGTQWIDTGIKGDVNLDFEIKFQIVGTDRYYNIMGDRVSASERLYSLVSDRTSTHYAAYLTCGNGTNVVNVPASYRTTGIITYRKVGLDIYVDTYKVGTISSQDFETPYNIFLFACRTNGSIPSPSYAFKGRIASCKFTRNNQNVRNYISVRKDGVGYLYDEVSGTLFGNAGSGSFTYGNDVNS